MPKAKEGVKYAIIVDDKVYQIFTKEELSEWSNDIKTIELSAEQAKDVKIGDKYDAAKNTIVEKTLDELKEEKLDELYAKYIVEYEFILGGIDRDERSSWAEQEKEALQYLSNPKSAFTPLIDSILSHRKEVKKDFVAKIIRKSDAYKQSFGNILGNYQKQKKDVENASSKEEVDAIHYNSVLENPF